MPNIKLIAAIDTSYGLAKKNKLPWDIPSDRKYFRDNIKAGPVVMGWNTFASNNFKPFGEGDNTVLTHRKMEAAPGVWIVHDARKFFETVKEDTWVIGGAKIFLEALPYASHLYLTRIEGDFSCDIFFPGFKEFKLINKAPNKMENGIKFSYEIWERIK